MYYFININECSILIYLVLKQRQKMLTITNQIDIKINEQHYTW